VINGSLMRLEQCCVVLLTADEGHGKAWTVELSACGLDLADIGWTLDRRLCTSRSWTGPMRGRRAK